MNQEERKQVGRAIAATAKYYSKQLDQDVLSMMIDDLENYHVDLILEGYRRYRSNHENRFFPLPAQIIEMIDPKASKQDMALDVTEKIIALIRKRGWVWQEGTLLDGHKVYEGKNGNLFRTFDEAVVDELGELGLQIVKRKVSWASICEESNESPIGVFKKQLADSANLNIKQQSQEALALDAPEIQKLIEPKEF